MTMDKSLRSKDTLVRHRNVLTRAERVEKLKEVGRWTDESKVMGMPKVAHRKVSVGKKTKTEKAPEAGEAAAAATADEPKKKEETKKKEEKG